jgi:hypothetical protein
VLVRGGEVRPRQRVHRERGRGDLNLWIESIILKILILLLAHVSFCSRVFSEKRTSETFGSIESAEMSAWLGQRYHYFDEIS